MANSAGCEVYRFVRKKPLSNPTVFLIFLRYFTMAVMVYLIIWCTSYLIVLY